MAAPDPAPLTGPVHDGGVARAEVAGGADPGPTEIASRSVERALDRKRAKYEEEVHRLIDAAVGVMVERQTVDPTVSEIVTRSGLSNAAFYRHFPSKDELVLATIERGALSLARYVVHVMETLDDPLDRIRAWVRALLQQAGTPELVRSNRPFVVAYPGLLERYPDETTRLAEATMAPLRGAVADACEAHGITGEQRVDDAMRFSYHAVVALLTLRSARGETVDHDEADRVAEYCVRGIVGEVRSPSGGRRRGRQ
jgi:AcrR family transcriptional regulator